jgi:hypothetical protein
MTSGINGTVSISHSAYSESQFMGIALCDTLRQAQRRLDERNFEGAAN